MNTILSGEKMVLAHSKTNYELPLVGVKDFEPNHSWLEQKQIQSALDSRKILLEAERVEKESNLMKADWKPEMQKAAVSRKGKHWETFGHHSDNTDWLFPEEVLFMMEMNCLECLYGDVPMSIQKGYSVLLKPENGCSLNEYRVFAHLCRAGYRVLRHLPNLTVTAYEKRIRLDLHLKERKTYENVINTEAVTAEEMVVEAQVAGKPKVKMSEGMGIVNTVMLRKPEDVASETIPAENRESNRVIGFQQLSKQKLRSIQRKNIKLRVKLMALKEGRIQKSKALRILQRRNLYNFVRKYKPHHVKHGTSKIDSAKPNANIVLNTSFRVIPDTENVPPEIPSERWQPPIVISDLPENIEMTIGSTPAHSVKTKERQSEKAVIEVIDIADTSSSEEEEETDEEDSDSDIEIIEEIRPVTHNIEHEEDEDDLEIIEVPVPKTEIIVETLSSDSEDDDGHKDRSGSDSERSYDGNWKRSSLKKKRKFVRPSTMSHLTFSAVDEFCAEKELSNGNVNGDYSADFIALGSSEARTKRLQFRVEKTRNEILDLMPSMAGENRKLMTLDSPDVRLIPDNIILKQKAYTYSTNALRARVFRQGFRGRRNFHGPRFTSFNPYYNTEGSFYPHQLSIGGTQGLLQSPQLSQMLGGGDISSVARGVMQIASVLLMNMPQNNMNNGLLPYNPRPHFPTMNPNFSRIESTMPSIPRFPPVNHNYQYNEQPNRLSFNTPQRQNIPNLFDMPQQRNFGTPNSHTRFSDNSSPPVVESSQNFSIDISRSSESDFDSRDHTFTPPICNSNGPGRSFRSNNQSANFRSNRGRFRNNHKTHHRGGFRKRYFSEKPSRNNQRVDPAYVKPDIPISGMQNSTPQESSDFIPIVSSVSNQNSVDIISIDDNDDGFVSKEGNSQRLGKKTRRKRKLMRMKEKAKKRVCQNVEKNYEIVFLDSPGGSSPSTKEPVLNAIKQENLTDLHVKTEIENENKHVKQEGIETSVQQSVKQESIEVRPVKIEHEVETRVKTEEVCGESSGVTVKVEQRESGQNVRVEIKIESSSDTSSVVSLPLTNLVKEEPCQIKTEPASVIKTEAMGVIQSVKTESLIEHESKEGILEMNVEDRELQNIVVETSGVQVETMNTSAGESRRIGQNKNENVTGDLTDGNCEVRSKEVSDIGASTSNEVNSKELASEDMTSKVSSWAEIKKNNMPLPNFLEPQDESENEDEEEITPLLRPKHCKTIGTVLSTLQIFTPLTRPPPEDGLKLKISFDLYLPTEFRKSHRGLPQYRVVVFSGTEPLPSPAQLREVNSRFQDSVPVLTAVVTPGSVVFYTFTDIDLPQDSTSYSK